jgi:flagellar motor switch protein FliN
MELKANQAVERWCTAWTSGLASLMSGLTGSQWTAQAMEYASDPACDTWFGVCATGANRGAQRMALGLKDSATVLTLFTGESPQSSVELGEVQHEALTEFIRQWAGLAQSALKPDFGEIALEVSYPNEMTAANAVSTLLQVHDSSRSLQVLLQLSEELTRALSEPDADTNTKPRSEAAKPSAGIAQLLREGNLELLMDLELPASLRFGGRKATLGDLLELTTGAVVELDRDVGQPVDLVINDIVVARGEVVVVDGDYGLRITELGSPRQRIGSLLDLKCEDKALSQ